MGTDLLTTCSKKVTHLNVKKEIPKLERCSPPMLFQQQEKRSALSYIVEMPALLGHPLWKTSPIYKANKQSLALSDSMRYGDSLLHYCPLMETQTCLFIYGWVSCLRSYSQRIVQWECNQTQCLGWYIDWCTAARLVNSQLSCHRCIKSKSRLLLCKRSHVGFQCTELALISFTNEDKCRSHTQWI